MSEDWMAKQQAERADAPRGAQPYDRELDEGSPRRGKRQVRVLMETFSVFRPWQGCFRCQKEIEDKTIVLPENSDYVCKHTRHALFVELMTKLRTDPTYLKLSYRSFSNERGESFVEVLWEEPTDGAAPAPRRRPVREL